MARVTVSNTEVTVIARGTGAGSENGSVVVRVPTGGNDVHLDVNVSNVATTTGFTVAATQSVTVPLGPGDVLYGIASTGAQAVHVLGAGADIA